MYLIFPSLDDVRSMADIRARAEFLAWMTHDAYRDAAHCSPGLSRSERAVSLLRARDYKRRAVRVSQYLNRRAA